MEFGVWTKGLATLAVDCLVLSVFEEEGWPRHIDDPLPHVENLEPKRRLHDTIQCLNRKHRVSLLRFLGDGTGLGVCWEDLGEKGESEVKDV